MNFPRADTFEEFSTNVLLAADDLFGKWELEFARVGVRLGRQSPHEEEIWDAFSKEHAMPSSLLTEDPDCSSCRSFRTDARRGVPQPVQFVP